MRTASCLLLGIFCLFINLKLFAQSEDQKKKSSLEVIGQVYGGPAPLNENRSFFFISAGEANVSYFERVNPEIQVRYIRSILDNVSVYGGLSYGVNYFRSSLFINFLPGSTPTFFGRDNFGDTHKVTYGSAHAGIRYTVNVGKDDSFNFSLGGKAIFYPKQDSNFSMSGFSENRKEDFTFLIDNTISSSSKFVFGAELEVNYQLRFKKFPVDLIFGTTIDRATAFVSELNSQVIFADSELDFTHDFGGGRVGAFVGLAYDFE